MSKTAQETAREALKDQRLRGMNGDARAAWYHDALLAIQDLPASAPFALPVDPDRSVRVAVVDSVTHSGVVESGVTLWRYTRGGDMDEIEIVRPPYAAAWLALFGVPAKEASK